MYKVFFKYDNGTTDLIIYTPIQIIAQDVFSRAWAIPHCVSASLVENDRVIATYDLEEDVYAQLETFSMN